MKRMHYFNITYKCDSDCKFCAANIGLINHNGYTMSTEQFEKQLVDKNVHEGDYIMVSGGEPSLSPYFWDILDVCRKYGCHIELTTNAHSFSDYELAKKLCSYDFINIQIPLFGMEEHHDYLVGHKGGFQKTIQALDNFAILMANNNFSVSVKFLLCKATASENIKVYNFCKKRFGMKFYYYLNALLVSEKVINNSNELLERYSTTIKRLGEFIEQDGLIVDTIPLCLLSEKKRNEVLSRRHFNFEKIYSDAKEKGKDMDNYTCEKCRNCQVEHFCDRYLPSYINYFGDGEICPIFLK